MPELRWTLLILGALFVGALAWWEVRRQRQAPRQGPQTGQGTNAERQMPAFDSNGDLVRGHREPTISFPELQPQSSFEPITASRAREPVAAPPVIEVDDASFARLDAGADRMEHEIAAMDSAVDEVSASEAAATHSAQRALADRDDDEEDDELDEDGLDHELNSSALDAESLADTLETTAAHEGPEFAAEPESVEVEGTVRMERPPGIRALAQAAESASAAGDPVVEWPAEDNRRILALRLVSAPAERFQGRAVRLALAAEGFVLGKFDIFHKAGGDERAVLSAASLTKPGTFSLSTMDAQRFGGLSLFAVLPGPLPPQAAFDELVTTARSLNDRLQGALQDERGEPLTAVRSASIRQSLGDPADPRDSIDDSSSGTYQPGTGQ